MTSGLGVQEALNRLAGTSGLAVQAAANGAVDRLTAVMNVFSPVTTGQETFPRALTAGLTQTLSTGTFRVGYFTAQKSETVVSLRLCSAATAAGATPTLVRFGLYTAAADGAITLVASTPNDTTLFAAQNTGYTKALSVAYPVVAGTRYALGALVVTAAAAPTIQGYATGIAAQSAVAPRLCAFTSGAADLPSSVTAVGLSDTSSAPYGVLLPA